MIGGRVLIVSAFAPEIAPLRRLLRRPLRERSAANAERGILCHPVGIGLVDAAAGAASLIAAHRPSALIFVGTAGRYGARGAKRGIGIGSVVVANRLHLVSTAALRQQGYVPAPLVTTARTSTALRRALLGERGTGDSKARHATAVDVDKPVLGDVATTVAITRAPQLASRIADATGAVAENLEAFAVARAAARARVPFAAVLGIANRVGPSAHEEWLRHQALASTNACRVIADALFRQRR